MILPGLKSGNLPIPNGKTHQINIAKPLRIVAESTTLYLFRVCSIHIHPIPPKSSRPMISSVSPPKAAIEAKAFARRSFSVKDIDLTAAMEAKSFQRGQQALSDADLSTADGNKIKQEIDD
jgi:hypothetical protein